MRILVTRPEPDGARFADILRQRNHQPVLAPVLTIQPLPDARWGEGPWAALLITSANAVRTLAGDPRLAGLLGLPVLAVGAGSAAAARAAGFVRVESADGDGGDLAALVATRYRGTSARLLYLAGENRARDLAGSLAGGGLTVETVAIYRAVPVETLPAPVREALKRGTLDGVAHFSRRSALAYLRCVSDMGEAGLRPLHFCISEPAAEPLRAAGARSIAVADRPDEAALLALTGLGA